MPRVENQITSAHLLHDGLPLKRLLLHEVTPRQAVDMVHGQQCPPEFALALLGGTVPQCLCQAVQVFYGILGERFRSLARLELAGLQCRCESGRCF